ncbi:MAG: helix-hairpin-helix domain-containing protein [Helicobacteraceae bacterium]|jgi:competence protein ComEA|nr:helix-hairpin-helix domain-containing protein [Helicobacteraceae bacterium]
MKFLAIVSALMLSVTLWAVNINSASVEELSTLPGIGQGTAEKIVKYRKDHKFKITSDLMEVKGIGTKKFEKIKSKLSV